MLDIFFIQYDEPLADDHFAALVDRFPFINRIQSVVGIHQAHAKAARLSVTENFYVVDADAIVYESFDFSFVPPEWDKHYTHVWYADNPVNGSCYGYGGIKLFHKDILLSHNPTSIDFTTSASKGLKITPTAACMTKFDQTALLTFRSVVREVVKLGLQDQNNIESKQRYQQWKTPTPNTEFIDAYSAGVQAAADLLSNSAFVPTSINDYSYLEQLYSEYDTK